MRVGFPDGSRGQHSGSGSRSSFETGVRVRFRVKGLESVFGMGVRVGSAFRLGLSSDLG